MPVLRPGKHLRARNGACLMEYVSVLAGESFGDAPKCTDPTLAAIARAVNDYSSDEGRQRLAPLASDLAGAGPISADAERALVRRCLLTAIPYSCSERRRVLIVALLGVERASAGATKGFERTMIGLDAEFALLGCDTALREASERVEALSVGLGQHHKRGLAAAIELAVATIADEAANADELLYQLLVSCLEDHRREPARGSQLETHARGSSSLSG
jgi:hypothetical protein